MVNVLTVKFVVVADVTNMRPSVFPVTVVVTLGIAGNAVEKVIVDAPFDGV